MMEHKDVRLEAGVQANAGYAIFDLKTGLQVAHLNVDSTVADEGDPTAIAQLRTLLRREVTVREHIVPPTMNIPAPGETPVAQNDVDDDYDPYPEESMCYFGMITLRPGDPQYLAAFLRRLPYISFYEARPITK